MKHKRIMTVSTLVMLCMLLSTPAFALTETEVQNAIAASSQEAVAGNIFIWFLCAVAFLKISQKIDSFMSSLGINVGRTGGSMLGELLIAGRAVGEAVKATGGAVGGIFNHNHSSSSTTNQAAGQAFTGSGGGMIGTIQRAAGNAAANSATGRGSGLAGVVGGAMLGSSMKSGGKFATNVVSAVATGNIASVGSITGEQASQALTSYLGYNSDASGSSSGTVITAGSTISGGVAPSPADTSVGGNAQPVPDHVRVGGSPSGANAGEDYITEDGGATAAAVAASAAAGDGDAGATFPEGRTSIPAQPPQFRNVEIGGGRITGYETPAGGGEERQFAMYNAAQYMEPVGSYETVQTADGENWYKQYAEPTVQKTPFEDESGKIQYNEKIVEQMPQIPKRKDRV